ncbi:hypothetical protein [Rhodocaloribacter sp.]
MGNGRYAGRRAVVLAGCGFAANCGTIGDVSVVVEVTFDAPGIFHTFKAAPRIMAQAQSSWFPLADHNPQVFPDIYHAPEDASHAATHRLHSVALSHLRLGRLSR